MQHIVSFKTLLLSFILLLATLFVSCRPDPYADRPTQTLVIYMPWSTNLTTLFEDNLLYIEKVLQSNILIKERIVVCFATNSTQSTLFEISYNPKTKTVGRTTFRKYNNLDFTQASTITNMLLDVQTFAPADQYMMVVGGHGMGWIPVQQPASAHTTDMQYAPEQTPQLHFDYSGEPLTRYFGGITTDTQTDITTLAQAINDANLHFEYIAFDDCYMANVETTYDLRHCTDHIIASPTEIMAYGYPYHLMLPHMIGIIDYAAICSTFLDFYTEYTYPYATLSVIKTKEIERTAQLMSRINALAAEQGAVPALDSIQLMDGYTPSIFFDCGSYVDQLCTTDAQLLSEFHTQLTRLVPHKAHTSHFPTGISGFLRTIPIHTYSGVTISDPSTHYLATQSKLHTAWYKATH